MAVRRNCHPPLGRCPRAQPGGRVISENNSWRTTQFFVGDKSAFQDQHEEGRKGHHESKAATILPMYTPEGRPILITIYHVT